MNRDKNPKEMIARIEIENELCGKPCDLCKMYGKECMPERMARKLTAKGYRKASEVALEVINKAMSIIQIRISALKQYEQTNIITEFNGGAKTALEVVLKDLAELKKKYTEGGE